MRDSTKKMYGRKIMLYKFFVSKKLSDTKLTLPKKTVPYNYRQKYNW